MSRKQDMGAAVYIPTDIAGDRIQSQVSTGLSIVSADSDEAFWAVKDCTAGYFAGDFEHIFSFICTTNTGAGAGVYLWGISNSAAIMSETLNPSISFKWVRATDTTGTVTLRAYTGSAATASSGAGALATNTRYWVRIVHDLSVGTYGTVYAYIATDPWFQDVVVSINITLLALASFRYCYCVSGLNNATAGCDWSGKIYDLSFDVSPYTLEQYRANLRSLLNEATAGFFTDAELNGYINDAYRETARLSGAIQRNATAATTGGTRTVSFTGYRVRGVEYTDSSPKIGLPQTDPRRLGNVQVNSTTPAFWYEVGSLIGIEPKPAWTHNLRLYTSNPPSADLSLDVHLVEVPHSFRPLITLNAFHRALMKERRVGPARMVRTMYLNELVFATMDKAELLIPDGWKDRQFE